MPRAPTGLPAIGELDAKTAVRLVGASSDIALVLDDQGTIVDVLSQNAELGASGTRSWLGRPWVQTVTTESRQKVEALLRDAQSAADATARWRQVNHPVQDGDDLPLLYSAVRLSDGPPDPHGKGCIVAFGRDLRAMVALQRRLVEAQQTMERDYWRFREAETRYRHLFETSSEAVLIVDGLTQKVLEANPVARTLCAGTRAKLVGTTLSALFDAGHAERLQNLLAAARSVGRQDPIRARLAVGNEVTVSASVFRQDEAAFVLVRLAPVRSEPAGGKPGLRGRAAQAAHAEGPVDEAMLRAFMQSSPDGLVFCDPAGKVIAANRAFLSLAQLSAEEQARGQALDRWVGRTGIELGVLITNLRQRGTVGLFITSMRGEYGGNTEVEISAAVLNAEGQTMMAFALRDIERRLKPDTPTGALAMPRSVSELTELVGRTPLKDIVSETTDLIEQLCIETALEMTHDNRASAALLLGLSRQSLYVKLRRYGLGSLGNEEES
ncbi:MAG TPA: transcriptional regulator PpsR [Rubrivivax sp.]|nr:transcriptional regulator PpsR [Rubrivivax sp.]